MAEEISWLSVIIIILLTGAYSATTFLGTNTFDKCDEINLDQEKININRLMNHSLTASITLASTLLLQKFEIPMILLILTFVLDETIFS